MDVCTVPPEHRAFLHLGPSTRDAVMRREVLPEMGQQPRIPAAWAQALTCITVTLLLCEEQSTFVKAECDPRLQELHQICFYAAMQEGQSRIKPFN